MTNLMTDAARDDIGSGSRAQGVLSRSGTGFASSWGSWGLPWLNPRVLMVLSTAVILGFSVAEGRWAYTLVLAAGACAFIWPVQLSLGVFALMIPFDFITVFGTETGGTTLTWLVGAAAASILLAKGLVSGRLESPPRSALWWSLFIAWGTVTVAWAPNLHMALLRLPTAWSLLLFYLVAVSFRVTRKEFFWTAAMATIGGIVAAAYASYGFYNGNLWATAQGGRASLVLGTSQADPNYFAASLLLPLSLAIGSFLSSRVRWRRLALLSAISLISFALLLSMSRGALVAVLVMAFVYFRRLRFKWALLAPIAVFALVLVALPTTFFTRILGASASRGAGRLDIWLVGLAAAKDHGIIGAGLSNFSEVYNNHMGAGQVFRGASRAPHNIYLEMWVELGIIGILCFAMAVVSQLREAKACHAAVTEAPAGLLHFSLACEATCWGMLACSFFLGLIWFKMFWFSWILLAIMARLQRGSQGDIRFQPFDPRSQTG